MSIKHAILGMLSCKPLSGYDLKKMMQDLPFMYWSGNNNQIYKALFELRDEGYVTGEVLHRESSPSKKIYTITDAGASELKRWVRSAPEAPEIKKPFLIQLAWAAQLSHAEIETILSNYEQEIKGRLFSEEARRDKGRFTPNRTPREDAVWDLIYENVMMAYTSELNWIRDVRRTVNQFDPGERIAKQTAGEPEGREGKMIYRVIEKNNRSYVFLDTAGNTIQTERDGLELVSVCAENNTNLLLISGERLSDEFLRLGTGVAGAVLQKLTAYNIKTAVALDADRIKGKFKELLLESNRSNTFRAYADFQEAENWLVS